MLNTSRDAEPAQSLQTPTSKALDGRLVIEAALGGLYKADRILARDVTREARNQYRVTFEFPPYDRVIASIGHVSGNQMGEALLEALYCAVASSIVDGTFLINTTLERFRELRSDFILFGQDVTFRKMLREGEQGELRVKIGEIEDVSFLHGFKMLSFQLFGFMKGTVRCLLSDKLVEGTTNGASGGKAADGN